MATCHTTTAQPVNPPPDAMARALLAALRRLDLDAAAHIADLRGKAHIMALWGRHQHAAEAAEMAASLAALVSAEG